MVDLGEWILSISPTWNCSRVEGLWNHRNYSRIIGEFLTNSCRILQELCQQFSALLYCYSVPTLSLYSVFGYIRFYAYDRILQITPSCTTRATWWSRSALLRGVTMAPTLTPTAPAVDTTSYSTEPSAPTLVPLRASTLWTRGPISIVQSWVSIVTES